MNKKFISPFHSILKMQKIFVLVLSILHLLLMFSNTALKLLSTSVQHFDVQRHTNGEHLSFFHRVNVGCGPAEERVLLTGLHAVADIYCENCKTTLGWKYVSITTIFPVDIFAPALSEGVCMVTWSHGKTINLGTRNAGSGL